MTPFQSPPWRKRTELAGGKDVKAEWQSFPEKLLTITNEQASAIPCNGRAGRYTNVVQHALGDMSELALYRIGHKKLATKIVEAVGFTEQHEQIKNQTALWKFGILNPQAEYSFPVYCVLGQKTLQLDKIVNQLCMAEQKFLLITSTSSLISNASSDTSNRHKSKLIGIDDVLSICI